MQCGLASPHTVRGLWKLWFQSLGLPVLGSGLGLEGAEAWNTPDVQQFGEMALQLVTITQGVVTQQQVEPGRSIVVQGALEKARVHGYRGNHTR